MPRTNLSQVQSDILYHIDTGCPQSALIEQVIEDKWTESAVRQALDELIKIGLVTEDPNDHFLKVNWYSKDIKWHQEKETYSYPEES